MRAHLAEPIAFRHTICAEDSGAPLVYSNIAVLAENDIIVLIALFRPAHIAFSVLLRFARVVTRPVDALQVEMEDIDIA